MKDSVLNEEFSERQPWLLHQESLISSPEKRFSSFLKTAGRYELPLSLYEKLRLLIQQKLHSVVDSSGESIFSDPGYPVPIEWQVIIYYLFEQGLIREPKVQFESLFNDEPKIHMLRLWATSSENLTDGGGLSAGGYSRGVSQDFEEAISKVIGELLERYPLTLYRDKNLMRGSIKSFRKKQLQFLDPARVAPFSEAQKEKFPNRRFTENSIFRWVEGKSLMSGKSAYMPAQLVFWNYRRGPEEPVIQQSNTSGAGGMFTLTEAILSGLYELIQRDAFFIHWFNKIAPPRVIKDSIKNPDLNHLLDDLKRYHIELEILNITSDFTVPAFLAVLIDDSGKGPAISFGAGCGRNQEHAILRAVTEAIGVRHWLRGKLKDFITLPNNYEPFTDPLSQEKRLLIWANIKMKEKFEFFLRGPLVSLTQQSSKDEESPEAELRELKDKFKSRGDDYEIFYYEASHPVLKRLGYHSVSVSVPAMLPLYLNETYAPLGSERIQEACIKLGYKPSKEINSLPHPFP